MLLLAARIPQAQLTAGFAAALQVGSTDPAVVAVEARRHAGGGHVLALSVPETADEQVGAAFDRPAPSRANYDTLLEATHVGLRHARRVQCSIVSRMFGS